MSTLSVDFVRYVVSLFEGVVLTDRELQSLISLVGERDELLAHLIFRRGSFVDQEEILSAIREAAQQLGQSGSSLRSAYADYARVQSSYDQWASAVRTVVLEGNTETFQNATTAASTHRRRVNEFPESWRLGNFRRIPLS